MGKRQVSATSLPLSEDHPLSWLLSTRPFRTHRKRINRKMPSFPRPKLRQTWRTRGSGRHHAHRLGEEQSHSKDRVRRKVIVLAQFSPKPSHVEKAFLQEHKLFIAAAPVGETGEMSKFLGDLQEILKIPTEKFNV